MKAQTLGLVLGMNMAVACLMMQGCKAVKPAKDLPPPDGGDQPVQQPAQQSCISFSVLLGLFQCGRRYAQGNRRFGSVLVVDALELHQLLPHQCGAVIIKNRFLFLRCLQFPEFFSSQFLTELIQSHLHHIHTSLSPALLPAAQKSS